MGVGWKGKVSVFFFFLNKKFIFFVKNMGAICVFFYLK